MKSQQSPTLLIYGTPKNLDEISFLSEKLSAGIILDNGLARDPIFTFAENLSRADAIIAYPNAHPLHLVSLIAEAEVGHPLLQKNTKLSKRKRELSNTKPIVFFGAKEEWVPFKEQFQMMRSEGLIRLGFDKTVRYEESKEDLLSYLEREISKNIPSTRLNYYNYSMKPADITIEEKDSSLKASPITISFFGSASSKSSLHLARADAAARMCSKNNWNILHGGGDAGIMGQLSASAKQYDAYVFGVSVDFSGAPKIFFERKEENDLLESHDHFVASKDMLHRIETYAGYSEAFVALDGGIGSLQEILVISELLACEHPAVHYQSLNGTTVAKPLYVVNESAIYDPIFTYLQSLNANRLLENIIEVDSIEKLHLLTKEFFLENPPIALDIETKRSFRDAYIDSEYSTMN